MQFTHLTCLLCEHSVTRFSWLFGTQFPVWKDIRISLLPQSEPDIFPSILPRMPAQNEATYQANPADNYVSLHLQSGFVVNAVGGGDSGGSEVRLS